jgi:asparagine synthase (glutamine-hydrolysing)
MCGIAGEYVVKGSRLMTGESDAFPMLAHRGPDGRGAWTNTEGRVGLFHTRLSIIDLEERSAQPMISANGNFVIIFNGEIYNFPELKKELEGRGVVFRTTSDTEVLLEGFALDGEKILARLDGAFAFAVFDIKKEELFCARDRFGEKPFYFIANPQRFAFASELKVLKQIEPINPPGPAEIFRYLFFGNLFDPDNDLNTFYPGISSLPPAHYIKVQRSGKWSLGKYWETEPLNLNRLSEAQITEEFYNLFETSVKRRLRSDVPVGTSLSGGLDSSSIAVVINRIKEKGSLQKTFSARFPGFERDEGKFIDKVIESCNLEPFSVTPDAESALGYLDTVFFHQEFPFGSSSINAQFEVMRLARSKGVKVLLDGQGADEILGGYHYFFPAYLESVMFENPGALFKERKNIQNLHGLAPKTGPGFFAEALLPGLRHKAGNLLRKFKNPASPYFAGIHPEIVSEGKRVSANRVRGAGLDAALRFSLRPSGLGELLRYADRNSMAHGVEVRLPFLSHELVNFCFSLPLKYKIRKGWTKYILRKSLENLLPEEIAWRVDKVGYEPPQKQWLSAPGFAERFKEAEDFLIREKIITRALPHLQWSYLMLHMAFKFCRNEK